MTTHVIILAQGSQTRLPGLQIPKQLLELDTGELADAPRTILHRTLWMLGRFRIMSSMDVTVVCGDVIAKALRDQDIPRDVPRGSATHTLKLAEPGNSSLKGVHQALAIPKERLLERGDRIAILLGDTVYSWKCLLEILAPRPIAFVGTGDLGQSEGEIWGISWNRDQDEVMRRAREAALAEHPPAHFTEYQPGQLRRWLWAHCNFDRTPVTPYRDYYEVDDYTRDIDIPAHLELLPALARAAYEDDLRESGRLG